MRNVLPLIVIIFAVVALIIVVGFIIGTVAHNIKSESEEEVIEQQVVKEEITEPTQREDQIVPEVASQPEAVKPEYEKEIKITKKKIEFGKECEVQLLASSNYARIEQIKTALERDGYKSKILTLTKGKKIIYRLRLRGLYSETEGKRLGNEIVKKSSHVTSFWLDEIKDGKSVGQIGATVTQKPKETKTIPTSTGDYEIQILANTKRNYVEDKKQTLEAAGYKAKIVSTSKNGKTFYRLRLANSYSRAKATQVGNKLKKDVRFVTDYWIVPKSGVSTPAPLITKKATTTKDESLTEPIQYSIDPKYQPKNKKEQRTMTCNTNDINIRIGPGTYYAVDPIGKLMKGVTVFVVDEKNDWVKFTITPNDESWAGWVNKKYLK